MRWFHFVVFRTFFIHNDDNITSVVRRLEHCINHGGAGTTVAVAAAAVAVADEVADEEGVAGGVATVALARATKARVVIRTLRTIRTRSPTRACLYVFTRTACWCGVCGVCTGSGCGACTVAYQCPCCAHLWLTVILVRCAVFAYTCASLSLHPWRVLTHDRLFLSRAPLPWSYIWLSCFPFCVTIFSHKHTNTHRPTSYRMWTQMACMS